MQNQTAADLSVPEREQIDWLPMAPFWGVQIAAVTRLDHRPIGTGRMGPVVSGLRELYFDVVRGRVAEYRGWCHPVYADAPQLASPPPKAAAGGG